MPTKCLYCDEDYNKNSGIFHILFSKDPLCEKCRAKLKLKRHYIKVNNFKLECFYEYDEFFRSLILQYKECYDEALYPVFLYNLKRYLEMKYHGYTVVWVPSSKSKLLERGFDHMELMLKNIKLKKLNALYQSQDIDQKNKSFKERKAIQQSISLKAGLILPDKILLIDDVVTSGNSITAAYNLLKNEVTELKVLSLSCTKKWNKRYISKK